MMIWKANILIYLEYTDNETSKERRNPTSDEEGWTEAEVDDEIRQRRAKKPLTPGEVVGQQNCRNIQSISAKQGRYDPARSNQPETFARNQCRSVKLERSAIYRTAGKPFRKNRDEQSDHLDGWDSCYRLDGWDSC
jgi:hypothetical protein